MAIRTRIIKGKGLVQEEVSSAAAADTLDMGTSPAVGLSPFMKSVTARTATATLGSADVGISTLSGSGDGGLANALKITLPDPANVPLAIYGFRMLDARTHVITSSAGILQAFSPPSGSFGVAGADTRVGSMHVTMSAIVGSSAMFISDGMKYLMFAASGSHTFA